MKKTNGRKPPRKEVVQMFEGESQFIIPRKGVPTDVPVDVISTGERALNAIAPDNLDGGNTGGTSSLSTDDTANLQIDPGDGGGGGATEPTPTEPTPTPTPTEPVGPTCEGQAEMWPVSNTNQYPDRVQVFHCGRYAWQGWQYTININNAGVTYTATAGATPATVAAGLAALINATPLEYWKTSIYTGYNGTYKPVASSSGQYLTIKMPNQNTAYLGGVSGDCSTVAPPPPPPPPPPPTEPQLSSEYPYKGVDLNGYDCGQITAAIAELEAFSTVGLTSEAQAGLATKLNEAYSVKGDACSTEPPAPTCNTTFPYQNTTMSMLNCAQLSEAVGALEVVDRSALCAPQVQMEYDQKLAEAKLWQGEKCSYTPPPPPSSTEEPVVTEPPPPPPPSCSTTFPYQGTTMSMLSCAQLTEAVQALQAVDRSALCAPQQAEYDQKLAEAQQWQTDKCSYTPPPPPPVTEEPVATEPPPPPPPPVVEEPVVTPPPPSCSTTFPYQNTTMSMLNCSQLTEAVNALQAVDRSALCSGTQAEYDAKLADARLWMGDKCSYTPPPPPPVVEEPVVTEPPPTTTEPTTTTPPPVTEPVATSPSQTTFPYKSTTMSMLNCVQLNEAVDTLQAFNTAVLTPEAKAAYDVKLAEAKEWQKNKFCLTSPVNIGGQVAIPVIPISPIVGSAMGGMGAGAGAGGGEGGVLIEERKKDFNWWWLLVVAGAVVYYVSSDKKKK